MAGVDDLPVGRGNGRRGLPSDDRPSIGRGSVSGSARRDWALAQCCTATTADVGGTRHVYPAFCLRQMSQRLKIATYFDKK